MNRYVAITTVLVAAFAGCHCGSSKPEGAPATAKSAPGTKVEQASGPPLASKDFYRLDLAGTPECKVDAPCDVKIALTALGGHHVNVEYPQKFVPVPSGDLVVEGTGTFAIENPTRGVMSIRLTPASAGTHTLNGQFRLGVCTDDKCEIDSPKIELAIVSL